jgi:TolB-like protein
MSFLLAARRNCRIRDERGEWLATSRVAGGPPAIAAFAQGLTEGVISGLLRFSYLRVIARDLTERHGVDAVDFRFIRDELGARYVVEGTLRKAGAKLRITMLVANALSAANLWSETYEQLFDPDSQFELQDQLGAKDRRHDRRWSRHNSSLGQRSTAHKRYRANDSK